MKLAGLKQAKEVWVFFTQHQRIVAFTVRCCQYHKYSQKAITQSHSRKKHESLLNVTVQILNQEFCTIQIGGAQNVSLRAFPVLTFFALTSTKGQ